MWADRARAELHFALAFSPTSIRRRMASDLETSCFSAQASSAFMARISNRAGIVPPYFVPGGRPMDFLCTDLSCLAMTFRIQEKQAEEKQQLPPRL
jgi:hypothetical protein